MKIHLKILSAILAVSSFLMIFGDDPKLFFLFISVSTGLIYILESEIPFQKKVSLKRFFFDLSGSYPTTLTGKICQLTSFTTLLIYAISSAFDIHW
jgi:hypothetical protein